MTTHSYLETFSQSSDSQSALWASPYQADPTDTAHQFVLFLKPEITGPGAQVSAILEMVLERCAAFDVSINAARALPASILEQHNIMGRHYGVINAISRQGEAALAPGALEKLKSEYAEELAAGARVLGGQQFLAEQPEFSPLALSTLNDNVGTSKLGGGSYCMKLNVLGQRYLLLNPFHAYQLLPYTSPGRAILVLEGRSTRDWVELRQGLTGTTNPATAAPGSIRAELLARKEEFGLADVNQGSNGIHLSAGPLEGMVELQRFFSDFDASSPLPWNETIFGRQLEEAGLDPEALASNPSIEKDGQSISAFDLTEEVNSSESLTLLS